MVFVSANNAKQIARLGSRSVAGTLTTWLNELLSGNISDSHYITYMTSKYKQTLVTEASAGGRPMLSARPTSRAPLALAHTYRTRPMWNECEPVRGSLAKIHPSPPRPFRPSCAIRGLGGRGTRSEEVDLAHVTSIRLGRFRDTRSV